MPEANFESIVTAILLIIGLRNQSCFVWPLFPLIKDGIYLNEICYGVAMGREMNLFGMAVLCVRFESRGNEI